MVANAAGTEVTRLRESPRMRNGSVQDKIQRLLDMELVMESESSKTSGICAPVNCNTDALMPITKISSRYHSR
jgi:hypothetical protein